MKVRKRISLSSDLVEQAEEYARLDHRGFSELVGESLKQMMNRYPKKPQEAVEISMIHRVREIEDKIEWLYTQVHQAGKIELVTESNSD